MWRSAVIPVASISLFVLSAVPAAAESRVTFSRTVYTSGTAAVKGSVSLTWLDNDEVDNVDLTAVDYKCDNRGAKVSVQVKARSVLGTTGWTGTWGDKWTINTSGCGTTTTARDMYYGTGWQTDVSAIYSAKVTVCFTDAPCYTTYNDNPYSNDPDSSTG